MKKPKVECPFCNGQAKLIRNQKELAYRKEIFQVVEHFYKCDTCHEEFTTTESDDITLLQVHNQYREKHAVPFPDEIVTVRNKYGLSAKAMSEVLGLGVNGYSIYERGEIPSSAIGNLIYSAEIPEVFRNMLTNASASLKESTFRKALEKVNQFLQEEKTQQPFYFNFDKFNKPNKFTGYKTPNLEKIKNAFIIFISKCNADLNDRLKLNKLLFYVDFLNYKETGYSITGLSYRAIQYGPVPSCYDNIYALLENESIIYADWKKEPNESAREIFYTNSKMADQEVFSSDESAIIDIICERFKDSPSWSLVEISHKEKAWRELQAEKKIISYQQYAFDLLEF